MLLYDRQTSFDVKYHIGYGKGLYRNLAKYLIYLVTKYTFKKHRMVSSRNHTLSTQYFRIYVELRRRSRQYIPLVSNDNTVYLLFIRKKGDRYSSDYIYQRKRPLRTIKKVSLFRFKLGSYFQWNYRRLYGRK